MRHFHLSVLLTCCFAWLSFQTTLGQDELPSAKSVVRNYLRAIGGQMALASQESMKVVASEKRTRGKEDDVDQGPGPTLNLTVFWKEGRWIRAYSNGSKSGSDGSREWQQSTPRHAPEWRAKSNTYDHWQLSRYPTAPLNWLNYVGKVDVVGKEKINGRDSYRVDFIPEEGSPIQRYFDVDSKLLVKTVYDFKVVWPTDYRDVGGILVPFKETIQAQVADLDVEFELILESVEFNLELDDDIFAIPDSLKGDLTDK